MPFKGSRPEQEPTQIDWARMAAYIDGEGCIAIKLHRSKSYKRVGLYLQLTITNTDFRLAEGTKASFGGCVHFIGRKKDQWSPCAKWDVASAHARWILEGCLPYFIIKREQADIALAFSRTLGRRGVKGTPPEILEKQWDLRQQICSIKGTSSRLRISNVHARESENQRIERVS